MKKYVVSAAIFFAIANTANAQLDKLSKMANTASTAAAVAGFDVNKMTSGVMNQLTPKLKLSPSQITSVTSLISSFMGKKAGILGLLTSNPASYASQQSGLLNGLTKNLGGVLAANQLKAFTGLKPAQKDPSNPLSSIFF